MKWYVTPANREFSQWHPRAMAKSINANVSLPSVEPQDAIVTDDWSIVLLTDNGASPGENQVVDARSITVANNAATAGYTYRDKTAEEIAAENDPAKFPLLPWQFKAMVSYLGKDAAIRTAINSISDPLEKAVALSRYENATSYRYDDAFLQSMRVAISMSEADLSAAWMTAKDLSST